jgi:hypothetical protein
MLSYDALPATVGNLKGPVYYLLLSMTVKKVEVVDYSRFYKF